MPELPPDVWHLLAQFLLGTDLVALAIVNRTSWRYLSHDDCWRDRIMIDEHAQAAQVATTSGQSARMTLLQRYLHAYSFRFRGLSNHVSISVGTSMTGVYVSRFIAQALISQHNAMSFDIWFCLLDQHNSNGSSTMTNSSNAAETREVHLGGVLVGGRLLRHMGNQSYHPYRQYAVVSSDRKLYCSVHDHERPESIAPVATDLELHRWYHLALSFDHTGHGGEERVYLDGNLVRASTSARQVRLSFAHATVGDGRIDGVDGGQSSRVADDTRMFPTREYVGRYAFNGLIDAFRLYDDALTSEQIHDLANGRTTAAVWRGIRSDEDDADNAVSPQYVMKCDATGLMDQMPPRVCCTRPLERIARIVDECDDADRKTDNGVKLNERDAIVCRRVRKTKLQVAAQATDNRKVHKACLLM